MNFGMWKVTYFNLVWRVTQWQTNNHSGKKIFILGRKSSETIWHIFTSYPYCRYKKLLRIWMLAKEKKSCHWRLKPVRFLRTQISPAPGSIWWVCRSNATSHRCQELLPFLLHKARCPDDLVSRCTKVRPIDFLGKVFSDHF